MEEFDTKKSITRLRQAIYEGTGWKSDNWDDDFNDKVILNEMAQIQSMPDKRNRNVWSFKVYVKGSEDEGGARKEHLPIHGHVIMKNGGKDIGRFNADDQNPPKSANEIIEVENDNLPSNIKHDLFVWANEKNETSTDENPLTNWEGLRLKFKEINKHLF